MNPAAFPSLFISHGSPMTALVPGAGGEAMARLGRTLDARFGRPKAVLAISAHTMAREPVLLAAERHQAVHDFGGFDPALRTLRYNAPGDPLLAQGVAEILLAHGIPVHATAEGGLDHGIWTALRHVYPEADVPVLPMAWVPTWTPAALHTLGEALAPLARDGVLVMASGSITHNLRLFMQLQAPIDAPEHEASRAFRDWFAQTARRRQWDALLDYRQRAPHAVAMHPTDEHLLPWYIAAGVGGLAHAPQRVHDGAAYGSIGMDHYVFGPHAIEVARDMGVMSVMGEPDIGVISSHA